MNSGVCEENRAKVEDKVDASKLLPGLDEDTSECTKADAIIRVTETVKVRTCTECFFVFQIETNFFELRKNLRITGRE